MNICCPGEVEAFQDPLEPMDFEEFEKWWRVILSDQAIGGEDKSRLCRRLLTQKAHASREHGNVARGGQQEKACFCFCFCLLNETTKVFSLCVFACSAHTI